ncbi:hypothetical protein GALMADRAFT_79372 [Galerina marginata CBS 339.88]|uniref:Uncharacterized protein n=1 Tax=Galerina marginata (strain CBS 339.88) TaxID=685588 RepID=A0A067SJC4_GALM3|nr:hypothetical protein GALMADRAFT_79372 [Galerina marginata CBS 339.88]
MPGMEPVSDDEGGGEDEDEDEDEDDVPEAPEESAEAELKRLSKDWNSPIYVFFKPEPAIEYVKGRCVHVFECAAKPCKGRGGCYVRRYLDTGDAKSTGNLRKHAKVCWGEDAVAAADDTKDVRAAREALGLMKNANRSITAVFKRIGKDKITYSHRQHTKTEACAEIVRWVASHGSYISI